MLARKRGKTLIKTKKTGKGTADVIKGERRADRRAPHISGTRGGRTVDTVHRGRGGTVD
uniref:Uncharacterized protein n=1 Tax=Oryza sativa subsp. japonica TaxID=39947 RepID=Q6ERV9_ORYSJ|nr:hypothetical protein [Oryza sativa Japonica Group]BAD28611.1 hypothetical protein [Oryza sativa Japonica Group]